MKHDFCQKRMFVFAYPYVKLLCPRPRREGGNKRCFCPSVCPSVAYIANNSRTQRPSMPKFGRFLTVDATHIPVSKSNGQRSGSPGPLMQTHIVRHIFRMATPTSFELGIRMKDDDLHQPQAPRPERSRSQGHVISLSHVGPMAHKPKTNSCSITKICIW